MKIFNTAYLIDDSSLELSINQKIIQNSLLVKDVVVFSDPNNAFQTITTLDTSDFPEIIFVDIAMPEMNGHELIQKIKALPTFQKSDCILIYLSGKSTVDNLVQATINEVEFFIQKPLNQEKVKDVLTAIQLDRKKT